MSKQGQLIIDLGLLSNHMEQFFKQRDDADWVRHTEKNGQGWNLKQTVAHLGSVAEAYNLFITAALIGQQPKIKGIQTAKDLAGWNKAQIATREQLPTAELVGQFLREIEKAKEMAEQMSEADLQKKIPFPAYNRPISVVQLLGGQLSHPGLIHAAQLARGAQVEPLWRGYEPDFLWRQIDWSFQLVSLAYRVDRGGDLDATIRFVVRGEKNGRWYVHLHPSGGEAGNGKRKGNTTIYFRDYDILCKLLTQQINPFKATLRGQLFTWGNIPLALRLPHLCNPV